jgi:molybdopterin biosynthesis enzyme
MDGYALRQQDTANHETFRIVGQSLAGHPYTGSIRVGECARIFTGAVVPDGADLIVLQEQGGRSHHGRKRRQNRSLLHLTKPTKITFGLSAMTFSWDTR